MQGLLRTLWTDRSGATAVEFALIAPLLFMLLFGLVEAGRLVFVQAALHSSLSDAARCAAINPSGCSTAKALALKIEAGMADLAAPMPFDPDWLTIAEAPCGLSLSARLPYQPIILTIADISMTLSAEACARR